jgi:hypothetical protein
VSHSQDTARANHEDTADSIDDESGADPDDAIDANVLEALAQDFNPSSVNPDQRHSAPSDHTPSTGFGSDDPRPPPPLHPEPTNLAGTSPVVVEHFSHGKPGAPIPGEPEGSNVYHGSQETFQSSTWAPFHSQRDWEIARWAKMHGPTSSALADLLAIPGVSLSPIYR